jgi:hypothetical protein
VSDALRDHPEQWPLDSRKCIFLARVLDQFSDDDVWPALLSGELEPRVYCKGRTDFGPIQLSTLVLLDMDKDAVFANCQIEVVDKDTRRPPRIRRRGVPVPHWLYVTRASLEKFAKKNPATSGAEDRATRHLAGLLQENKDLTKEQAHKTCERFGLSDQGFDDRVWPDARELARLPRLGRAGRKSRS